MVQFTAGIWAYVFGATSLTGAGAYQYDAVSLLPGIFAFSCFLTCDPAACI